MLLAYKREWEDGMGWQLARLSSFAPGAEGAQDPGVLTEYWDLLWGMHTLGKTRVQKRLWLRPVVL